MSRTTAQVMAAMLADRKEITGIEFSASDFNRDEVVSLYPIAGIIASLEAKIENIEDDFHPDTASETGLVKGLKDRQLPDRIQPQSSSGRIKFSGTDGKVITGGFTVKRKLDGKIFICIQDGIVQDGEITLLFESLQSGQAYNIDQVNQEFLLSTPVDGLEALGVSVDEFRNGRDLESQGEMLKRIQDHDRRTDTGGNLVAYENWAIKSSPLVVSAKSVKHPRGVSTVDTYITSGTTDIDKAVEDGTPVTRLPSVELVDFVQSFITERMPTTDDHQTKAPAVIEFDSSLKLELYDESLRSRVEPQIVKIWKAFIYKAKPGQRISPTDIEKLIDSKLGFLIRFRRVADFTIDYYYDIPEDSILNPRTFNIAGL